MKARVSRAGIEQRIRQIERQLEQGKDGQLWTRRNRDLQGHLAQLRAMFAGRISFAEYLVWADENPGPDAGRTYTYDEEARRRAQFEEFKSQLAHTVERIRGLESADFFETRAESATASTATVNQKCPLCRTHLRPPSPCSW